MCTAGSVGAGANVLGDGQVLFVGSMFSGNVANGSGPHFPVTRCVVCCQSGGSPVRTCRAGGGVNAEASCNITFVGCVFRDNAALDGNGTSEAVFVPGEINLACSNDVYLVYLHS